jgi:twitching motility protein PilT
MRDLETMRMALTAAETGLVVYATVHTNSAAKAVDRIIDAFPAQEQEQVRIVSCRRSSEEWSPSSSSARRAADAFRRSRSCSGRRPSRTPSARARPPTSTTRSRRARARMISMDQSLTELVKNGIVEHDEALERDRQGELQDVSRETERVGRILDFRF